MSDQKRIILGISGAGGVIYGVRALHLLGELGFETHLIISKIASFEEMVDQTIGRMLLRMGIANPYYEVWGEK